MYKVRLDGANLYHPNRPDQTLTEAILTLELGKNGTFDCGIPRTNALADRIHYRRSIVEVVRYGEGPETVLYRGVVLNDETDAQDIVRDLETDGDLVCLSDTVLRPFASRSTTPAQEFAAIIQAHNAQADAFKRFTLGNVTVTGAAVRRRQAGYQATREALDALTDTYGGYVISRTEGDTHYIDWLATVGRSNTQPIQYGRNVLDISRQIRAEDMVTRLIPLGKSYDGVPTTIKTVNNNKDYIQDADVVKQFGIIEKTVEWSAIESPSMLLAKAQDYYKTVNAATLTVEVTAVDLADAGYRVEHLALGDWVTCVARPLHINLQMQITKLVLNLLDLADSRVTLGATQQTYTQAQLRQVSALTGVANLVGNAVASSAGAATAAANASAAAEAAAQAAAQAELGVQQALISSVPPVGAVLFGATSTFHPETYYPGTTWQRLSDGGVLIDGGTTYVSGQALPIAPGDAETGYGSTVLFGWMRTQ